MIYSAREKIRQRLLKYEEEKGIVITSISPYFKKSLEIYAKGHQLPDDFKLDQEVTSAKDRLAMLQAAAEETDSRICVSTMEVDKDTVSYTYITLGAIKQQLSVDEKLYFITGTDTYLQLADWKNGEEVCNLKNRYIKGSPT